MSFLSLISQIIFYQLTGNYTCFQFGNCTMTTTGIFNIAMMPYQWTLGIFAPVAIWGILLYIVWAKSQDTRLVAIVGIAVSTMLVSFYPPAKQIGWFLVAISAGITLYWLFILRPHGGTSS